MFDPSTPIVLGFPARVAQAKHIRGRCLRSSSIHLLFILQSMPQISQLKDSQTQIDRASRRQAVDLSIFSQTQGKMLTHSCNGRIHFGKALSPPNLPSAAPFVLGQNPFSSFLPIPRQHKQPRHFESGRQDNSMADSEMQVHCIIPEGRHHHPHGLNRASLCMDYRSSPPPQADPFLRLGKIFAWDACASTVRAEHICAGRSSRRHRLLSGEQAFNTVQQPSLPQYQRQTRYFLAKLVQ